MPYVIGIAGGSGSGKTFFLNCFLNHFTQEEVCLISQDDYYKRVAHNMTKEENKLFNFDLPDCFMTDQMNEDIQHLVNNQSLIKEEYTFNNSSAKPKTIEIKPAPILIIEGLFIYHFDFLDKLFNYRVFIDAAAEIALERRLNRDLVERGYSEEDVMYKWNNHVLPSFNQYLLPHRERCDLIVNNSANGLQHILNITKEISEKLKTEVL